MFLVGAFLCIGGTYGVVEVIIGAYASGEIGEFHRVYQHFPFHTDRVFQVAHSLVLILGAIE